MVGRILPYLAPRPAGRSTLPSRFRFSRPSLGPFLIVVGIGVLLLGAIYRLPIHRVEDVGAWAGFSIGLHAVETSDYISYVYTDGDARIQMPEAGTGAFALRLRLGGAGGRPIPQSSLTVGGNTLDLGTLAGIRIYHLLAPAGSRGDIGLRLHSPTVRLPGDPRALGALIDWLGLQSLGAGVPPADLLAALLFCLAVFSSGTAILGLRLRWQVTCLMLITGVLALTVVLFRAQVALAPWWLGLSLATLVATGLAVSERSPFLTSPWGIATIIVLWRLLLWLVGAVGLWWSEVVYRHGKGIASSFGRTIFDHDAILWRALAGAWMQWDSEHYQAIATGGYTFAGVAWPNIAFFPLYPLLIRLSMPLAGGNTTIAALAVSNLALLAALLLLYDLVARDFDRITAYRSVLLLLFFPTSVYFAAGYTESLALALAVAAVWAMRREHWWLAGLAGFLLALTRVPGVMIAPVLAIVYLRQQGWSALRRPSFLAVLLPPLGLASFMLYQWFSFGTPFAFLLAQQSWNNGMAPPWIIPEKILNALRFSHEWEMAAVQLVVWSSVVGLAIAALRRLPLVYSLTALLMLLPPFFAGQRGSLIRHVLIGFPIFVMLALATRRAWSRWLLFSLMLPLLVVFTLLFVNGFGLA